MIIGTGIDLIEISRIRAAIERNRERFLARVFTAGEQAYCHSRHPSEMHYAGRFAAKEAAFKALATGWAGGIKWVDVEVVSNPGGAPTLNLSGLALARFQQLGGRYCHVTITHTAEQAMAMVILES